MLAEKNVPDYWSFSLAVYRCPNIAQSCLTLQNRLQLDINVLLVALFATGRLGRSITLEEITAGNQKITAWRKEIVQPLRKIRTQLKVGPAPAPCSNTENLRSLIKSAELNAEFIEQSVLARWIYALPVNDEQTDADIYMLTAIRVVDFYASEIDFVADRADYHQLSHAIAKAAALQLLVP